jgi:hypothetical protein
MQLPELRFACSGLHFLTNLKMLWKKSHSRNQRPICPTAKDQFHGSPDCDGSFD